MKIWTNNNFEGYWSVGSAAVVVAESPEKAAQFLSQRLIAMKLKGEVAPDDMKELNVQNGNVVILCDGNY